MAGEVRGVGRGLQDVAEDDVVDRGRLDARRGPAPRRAAARAEVGGGKVLEAPPNAPKPVRTPERKRTPRVAWGWHMTAQEIYPLDHGAAHDHPALGNDHDAVADVEVGAVEAGLPSGVIRTSSPIRAFLSTMVRSIRCRGRCPIGGAPCGGTRSGVS